MKFPKDLKRTGVRTAIAVAVPTAVYLGLEGIQEAIPVTKPYWFAARDAVEIGKDIVTMVLANKFIGNVAKGENNDGDGKPVDHFGSDALDSLVKGLSVGVGAVLVSGDVAHSESIRYLNKEVSGFLGDVHGKIDQYIFGAALAWGAIKEYFPTLRRS